jgi:hypothetical protein
MKVPFGSAGEAAVGEGELTGASREGRRTGVFPVSGK